MGSDNDFPNAAAGEIGGDDCAVIDVGSNSVRLVIFEVDGRAMTPILNEKVMAGLGRDLRETGRLSREGVDTALRALKRFRRILEARGCRSIDVVGTAALRDAEDGSDFVARAKTETGLAIKIVSGAEEARLSTLGVLSSVPEANGVVGDLGGSSLELARLADCLIGPGETHALGPLALMTSAHFKEKDIEDRVRQALAHSGVLHQARAQGVKSFYAVGGAWRAIGRLDIVKKGHPIAVLNHHELDRRRVKDAVEMALLRPGKKGGDKAGEKPPEDSAQKRAEFSPYAGIVLRTLMDVGDFDRVILSARGLREGVLFDRLMRETPDNHPLLAAAEVFGRPQPQPGVRAYCRVLGGWMARLFDPMASVFADPARERLLREAAARISEYGATLHPDQRQENTFGLVLLAHHAGISNEERVFLAACAHYRYDRAAPKNNRIYDQFLTDDQKRRAQQIGAVMRLGAELSGRTERLLELFALRWNGATLELASETAPDWMISEPVERRLKTVGELLGAARTTLVLNSPPQ